MRAQTDINDSTENIDGNILYTYEVNNMVFESDISIDTPWYNAMKYQFDQGIITKDDWDSKYSDFISDFVATDEGELLSNSPSSNIETLSGQPK